MAAPGTTRISKYSLAISELICDGVRLGLSFSAACESVGVAKQRGSEWREFYPEFSDAVDEAAGECEHALIEKLQKSIRSGAKTTVVKVRDGQHGFEETTTTTDDGTANAKWMLSRINPDRWSERAAIAKMVENRTRREVESRIQYLMSVVDDNCKTQIATALMAAGFEVSAAATPSLAEAKN
jgi:hypothetical protein